MPNFLSRRPQHPSPGSGTQLTDQGVLGLSFFGIGVKGASGAQREIVVGAGDQNGHDLKFLIEEAEKNDLGRRLHWKINSGSRSFAHQSITARRCLSIRPSRRRCAANQKMPDTDVLIAAAGALIGPRKPCLNAK